MARTVARNRRINRFRAVGVTAAFPVAVFVGIFIMLPVGNIFIDSIRWDSFTHVIDDTRIHHVLWITWWQAAWSTVLALTIGIPLAAVLAHHRFKGKRVVATAFSMPFVLPTVVVALAALGLSGGSHPLMVIILTHAYFNVSVVVRVVRAHLATTVTIFENVAATLGAGPFTRLRTVDISLARRSITQAAALVFVFCVTSFGVVRIVGGLADTTTEVEIYVRAIQLGDMSTAAVLAAIQIVFLVAIFAVFRSAGRQPRTQAAGTEYRRTLSTTGRSSMWLAGALFTAPIFVILVKSLRARGIWTLAGWRGLDTAIMSNSIRFAVATAMISASLAVALVVATAHAGCASRVIHAVASLPVVVSSIVLSVGIVATFNRGWYDFRGSWWLLPVMHATFALPVCFRTLRGHIENLTDDHRDAAATLGSSPLRTVTTIDIGSLRPALVPIAAMAACISLGEFGASSVLTRNNTRTLPLEITRLLGRPGDINQLQAHALATILMVAVAVLLLIFGERNA